MLINERRGSFLFLGTLLLGLDLEPDRAAPGRCGTCARCLDACPTRAFPAPYLLDARRCISYLTIELRGPIPRELRRPMGEMVFGCDICQDVCPWNERAARREPPATEPAFRARPGLASGRREDLEALVTLTEEAFRERFRGSPVKRAKRGGLARNACVALGNRGDPASAPVLLRALADDPEPLVRGHAAWALGQIALRAGAEAATEIRAALARRAAEEQDAFAAEECREALLAATTREACARRSIFPEETGNGESRQALPSR
jgi:epoxyqueuosine reductase